MGSIASISFATQSLQTAKQKVRDDFRNHRLQRSESTSNSEEMPKDDVVISSAARRKYAQDFQMRTIEELAEFTGYSVEAILHWHDSMRELTQELRAQEVAEFESRPIELRIFSWGAHNLHDIMRGVELYDSFTSRELDHRLFSDVKDAPPELLIANSLAHHVSAFHLIDAGASREEVAMYREAAMRMALYFAENHLEDREASLFMAEMRAMKEVAIRMTQDTGATVFSLRVSDVREWHRTNAGDSLTQVMGSFVSSILNTPETIAAAENFDTWISEERFSSVGEWMERIRADIALL